MIVMRSPDPLPWYAIWLKALTRPSMETYFEISVDPGAKMRRAFVWLLLTSFLATLMSQLPLIARGPLSDYLATNRQWTLLVIPLLAALFLGLSAAAIRWGGRQILQIDGDINRVIFTLAAIFAPATLIGGLLALLGSFVPFQMVCWLHAAAFIYLIVLQILAIQAVYTVERIHAGLVWALSWLFLLPLTCLAVAIFIFINPTTPA